MKKEESNLTGRKQKEKQRNKRKREAVSAHNISTSHATDFKTE